jgi:hypothetical protein
VTSFDFGTITFNPNCPKYDSSLTVTYDAFLGSSGTPLPAYLSYNQLENTFTLTNSATIVPGTFSLGVKVTVTQGTTV